MQRDMVQEAKLVVISVVCEMFANDTSPERVAKTLRDYEERGELRDIDEYQDHYLARGGTFLVLLDGSRVVGTGALRPYEGRTAELKRMWFLPAYRGRGLGRKMAEQLLQFAREKGYTRVRLDTGRNQPAALKLYERLGFQEIERYNQSVCDVFMELAL
jgi:putative acetyltransferase